MQALPRVGIVGGGLMGRGIAETCLCAGLVVHLVEVDRERARGAFDAIAASLERAVARGRVAEASARDALGRLVVHHELGRLVGEVDVAVEAIVEDERAKRGVFAELDRLLPDAELLASNTSSVPIMKLAAATGDPARVVGLHFFNPVPVMALVEVVPALTTSARTVAAAERFATDVLGKVVIRCADRAGFVVNALLVPFILAAVRMYESGFASPEDIDRGLVHGCAHPMGPLALADLIGLDTLVAVARSLYDEFREPAAVVPAVLHRMVEAGLLGRKTGRGFYVYH